MNNGLMRGLSPGPETIRGALTVLGAFAAGGAASVAGALSVAGQILAADGLASAPGIAFTSGPYGLSLSGTTLNAITGGSVSASFTGDRFILPPANFLGWAQAAITTPTPGSIVIAARSTNAQALGLKQVSELTTIAATPTTTTAIQIPAGALVLAVSTRVQTAGVTSWPATYQVGDGVTPAKFNEGASVSSALNTTDRGTKAGPTYYAAATAIVITPSGTPGDALGRIRTTIHYLDITPPTS